MSKKVVKKDGREEPFIKEKIVVSAVKSGASVDIAREIADEIEDTEKEKIETKWVRKKVLDRLEYHNPSLPKKWVNYDKNIKRLKKYKR
ncbi:MAG: ATP cone domain-containing protein [Candidatus Thermoplasmatota archaeon]